MKKVLLFLFFSLIGFLLFWWIVNIVGWQEIKKGFSGFGVWQAVVIIFLTLLNLTIDSWKWQEILKTQKIYISFRKLWKTYLASYSIKYLFPMAIFGGEAVRGYFLKKNFSVPWSKGVASVIIDRILTWTVNILVVFTGISFFLFNVGLPPKKLAIFFGGAFLVFTSVIAFFYFKTFQGKSIADIFFKIFSKRIKNSFLNKNKERVLRLENEVFNFFKLQRKVIWKPLAIACLRVAALFLRTWLLIIFLGKSIGLLASLSVLGFTFLVGTIPIPTALGSHEAVQMFAFTALGLGAGKGTAFTMIIRGADVFISLIGLMLLFKLGWLLFKKIIFKKVILKNA